MFICVSYAQRYKQKCQNNICTYTPAVQFGSIVVYICIEGSIYMDSIHISIYIYLWKYIHGRDVELSV